MKKTYLIAVALIISNLSLSNLEAARRSMSSSSSQSKSAGVKAATKTSSKKSSSAAKGKKAAKTPVKSESASQKSAKKKTSSLTTSQKSKLLDLLNDGTGKELNAINGIAKVRSESIIKARPYQAIDELILVNGIGETTFSRIIEHAKNLPRKKSTKSTKAAGR